MNNAKQNAFNIEGYLDSLPDDTTFINLSSKKLTYIPDLARFKNLNELNLNDNDLVVLPPLPKTLKFLYCSRNKLETTPEEWPEYLEELFCHFNYLKILQNLPETMTYLNCDSNQITSITNLPKSLRYFYCSHNKLENLPKLPKTLLYFDCEDNLKTVYEN